MQPGSQSYIYGFLVSGDMCRSVTCVWLWITIRWQVSLSLLEFLISNNRYPKSNLNNKLYKICQPSSRAFWTAFDVTLKVYCAYLGTLYMCTWSSDPHKRTAQECETHTCAINMLQIESSYLYIKYICGTVTINYKHSIAWLEFY